MTGSPRVTVLMAVYNGERFLREAVESILGQSFRDFEFLIVNDGSTDRSGEMIRSFGDPRIRLVDNPENIGLTRSLNRGLELAKGALIARQDADDISLPERLEREIGFLDGHPEVAVVGCQASYIDEHGRERKAPVTGKATTAAGIRWQMLFGSPFIHGSVLFRREIVWERLGGYDPAFRTSQDFELWSRLLAVAGAANLPERMVRFRTHAGSVSSRYTADAVSGIERVIRGNLRLVLDSGSRFDEWPMTWIALVNRHIFPAIDSPRKAVPLLDAIHRRFCDRFPEAARDEDVRRNLAGCFMTAACTLASQDRRAAIEAFRHAHRACADVAASRMVKFCTLLLMGDSLYSLKKRLARARTRVDG